MIASTHHYLLIDGMNGGSLSDAYGGAFEVASYVFDIEAAAASGGGGAAGRTDFGPLIVDLYIGSGLAALAETAAEGRAISSIRLVGVTRNGDEVYDLKLADVRIARLSDAGVGKDRLAFSYGEIELTTTRVRDDGSLGSPETFRWDVARNAPGDGLPEPEPAGRGSGGGRLDHYLLIDGMNGGSLSDAYGGAFEVASYVFDIEAAAASGGGGAAGRTDFGPLIVDLYIGSGLAALADTAAEGRAISSIRLVGVTRNGDEVYDLKLADVRIARLSDAGVGKDRLAFSYGEIELTTTRVRDDGSLGSPETFRWDVARNAPGDGLPEPEPAGRGSGGGRLDHYLLIDGMNGGSLSDAYGGAFEVASYVFDIEAAAASGGGGAAGRTDFGPLIVDLYIGSGLAALAETAAEGRAISSIRLVGVTRNGDEVYDLKLADVRIARLSDAGVGKDRLAFSYGEIELTTTRVRDDGSLGSPETFRWDVARNAPGDGLPEPEPAGRGSGGGRLDHYLLIDGMNGGSLSDAYGGAFEVASYVFDIEAAAASGGGGAAGRTDFGPLIVDLYIGSGLAALAETAAEGRAISSIRLVGVTRNGDEVYDLKLADVRIARLSDAGVGKDRLAFSYGEIELTTTRVRDDGSLGSPETFRWDVARNAPGDGVPEPEPAGRGSGGGRLDHYLLIDGMNGGSLSDAYGGAFEVASYVFDIEAAAASGGGGAAGRTDFGPLIVDLYIGSGLAALAETAAEGRAISSIRLVGVTRNGDEVYDLKLADVRIARLSDAGVGKDRLAFSYGEIELTTTRVRDDGSLGSPETFRWDVARNAPGDGLPEPEPAGRGSGGGRLDHYLLIDGMNGGSLSDAYGGAFEVASYVFDIEAAAASGGGGAAGRTDFGPLIVDLYIGSGLAALADTAAEGRAISSIRLVGVTRNGDEVYDLKLADVRIARLSDAGVGKDRLAFSYGEIELTTTRVRDDGSLGSPETFRWDVARNAPGDGLPEPEPADQEPDAVSAATTLDEDSFVFVPTTDVLSIKARHSSGEQDLDGREPSITANYSAGSLVGCSNQLDATAYATAEIDEVEPITIGAASDRIFAPQVDDFL